MNISIKLGKEGEEMHTSTLTVEGCSCRLDDFVMELVAFANKWVREADAREKQKAAREQARESALAARDGEAPPPTKKPCPGCPERNAQ